MNVCSSSGSMPVAKAPPTRPPMLVPAATSIGIRCSSSQRMTPTWAMPRALPPPNATPTVGRFSSRRIRRCAIGPGRRRDGLCDFLNWRGASRATQCQQPREEPRQPLACRVRSRQLPHSATPCQRYHSRPFQLAPLPFDCEDDGASSRCQGRWWFCRRAGRACTAAPPHPPSQGSGRGCPLSRQLAIRWLWEMPTVFGKQAQPTTPRSGGQLTRTRGMIHRAEKIRNQKSPSADRDNAHNMS